MGYVNSMAQKEECLQHFGKYYSKTLLSFVFRAIVYDYKYGPTTCTVLCY